MSSRHSRSLSMMARNRPSRCSMCCSEFSMSNASSVRSRGLESRFILLLTFLYHAPCIFVLIHMHDSVFPPVPPQGAKRDSGIEHEPGLYPRQARGVVVPLGVEAVLDEVAHARQLTTSRIASPNAVSFIPSPASRYSIPQARYRSAQLRAATFSLRRLWIRFIWHAWHTSETGVLGLPQVQVAVLRFVILHTFHIHPSSPSRSPRR